MFYIKKPNNEKIKKIIERIKTKFTLGVIGSSSIIMLIIIFQASTVMVDFLNIKIYKRVLSESFSYAINKDTDKKLLSAVKTFLLGFDSDNPETIIKNQLPLSVHAKESESEKNIYLNQPSVEALAKNIPENTAPLLAVDMHPKNGSSMLRNSTTYSVDINQLMGENLSLALNKDGPTVLIVHSHASESFLPSDTNFYVPSDTNRTEDINYNIVRVGKEMSDALNQMGIETIHSTKLHDYPSYNGSYANSLKTVEEMLEKYPSIEIVIDVHRDSMQRQDSTRLKAVREFEGKNVAQVMIVCGSDQGGLYHPNWRENLKFALAFQNQMNQDFQGLTRSIDFRKERFNMHTTKASIILEVGSTGNTLEEAILGGKAAAISLGNLILNLKQQI